MNITKILTPAALVAAFALAAVPAQAGQHQGGGGHSGGRSHGAVSRGNAVRGGGATASRSVAQGRTFPAYRGAVPVRGAGRIAPGFVGGSVGFYRPYYSFRPRLSLGFGLWAGYPVAYPYYYGYPYAYPYGYPYPADPYAYGYAPPSYGYPLQPYGSPNQSSAYPPSNDQGSDYRDDASAGLGYQSQQPAPSIGVQRGQQSAPGGVSFEITPDTAAVFVDGTYVGTAGTFGPMSPPLGLIAGRHHIEVRASGYRTMTFDADVTAGQVVPYQGTLQRN